MARWNAEVIYFTGDFLFKSKARAFRTHCQKSEELSSTHTVLLIVLAQALPFAKKATQARSATVALAHNPKPIVSMTKKSARGMDKLDEEVRKWAYDLVTKQPRLGPIALATKIVEEWLIDREALPAPMTLRTWMQEIKDGVVCVATEGDEEGRLIRKERKHNNKFLLTQDEEQQLAKYIKIRAETWQAVPMREIDNLVFELLTFRDFINRQVKGGKDYVPLGPMQRAVLNTRRFTPKWRRRFLKKHGLDTCMTASVDAKRAAKATRKVAERHLSELKEWLVEKGIADSSGKIVHPAALVNFDECGQFFSKDTSKTRVVKAKGSATRRALHENRQQFTFTGTSSADGHMYTPQVIWQGKNKLKGLMPPVYEGGCKWHVSMADHGCQTAVTLKAYLEVILPEIRNRLTHDLHLPPDQPIVLLVDGHASRVVSLDALEAEEVLDRYNASYFLLPPHSSGTLQPMDQCYASFHRTYEKCRDDFLAGAYERHRVRGQDAALILGKAAMKWMTTYRGSAMASCWALCGIGEKLDVALIPSKNLRAEESDPDVANVAAERHPERVTRAVSEKMYVHALIEMYEKKKRDDWERSWTHPQRGKDLKASARAQGPVQGPVRPAVWNGQRKRKAEVNEKKAEKADADRQREEKRIAKKAKMAEDEAEKERRNNMKSELGRGIFVVRWRRKESNQTCTLCVRSVRTPEHGNLLYHGPPTHDSD